MKDKYYERLKRLAKEPNSSLLMWGYEASAILKEIERLNNENKMLKEAVKEKVIATCNTCEDYGICPHSYREYDLNNIINELEKYLNDRSEFTNFGVIIDKLQELKGEDKE